MPLTHADDNTALITDFVRIAAVPNLPIPQSPPTSTQSKTTHVFATPPLNPLPYQNPAKLKPLPPLQLIREAVVPGASLSPTEHIVSPRLFPQTNKDSGDNLSPSPRDQPLPRFNSDLNKYLFLPPTSRLFPPHASTMSLPLPSQVNLTSLTPSSRRQHSSLHMRG
jgi:hypothetical protein